MCERTSTSPLASYCALIIPAYSEIGVRETPLLAMMSSQRETTLSQFWHQNSSFAL